MPHYKTVVGPNGGNCIYLFAIEISYDYNLKLFEVRCMDDLLRPKTVPQATQEEKIRVIGDRYNWLEFLCI